MTPKLELRHLHKTYDDGNVVAVRDLSLTLNPGETLAILGPSGCGKSTTLNMIVGIETPTAGDILIDGESVRNQPAGSRNVGLVFQDYAVFTHMTVEQNIAFGLKVRGLDKAEIRTRVGETAEMLGLSGQLKMRATQLGGSELQRVAIGRTLVTKPALLLLDEPLSNLETEMRTAMRRELRRLSREIGLTIVYVTHDQIEALSLADHIAVMSDGQLRQCAPTDQVYEQPAHCFVARFIGEPPMNLIAGKFDGAGRFLAEQLNVTLPPQLGTRTGDGYLGLRADALGIATPGPDTLGATVTTVEPRGAEAIVTMDIGLTTVAATVPSNALPEAGACVSLSIDPRRAVFFDAQTERNLLFPGIDSDPKLEAAE